MARGHDSRRRHKVFHRRLTSATGGVSVSPGSGGCRQGRWWRVEKNPCPAGAGQPTARCRPPGKWMRARGMFLPPRQVAGGLFFWPSLSCTGKHPQVDLVGMVRRSVGRGPGAGAVAPGAGGAPRQCQGWRICAAQLCCGDGGTACGRCGWRLLVCGTRWG